MQSSEVVIPQKRRNSSVTIAVGEPVQRLGDIHRLIVSLLVSKSGSPYLTIEVLRLDSVTISENAQDCPFLNSLLRSPLYCKTQRPSNHGYLKDLVLLQDPIPKALVPTSVSKIEQFLMSPEQLSEHGFPVMHKPGFVETSEQGIYKDLLGLDCEMVKTSAGFEIARVSIVNNKNAVLYDEFVLPQNPVTDYLTAFSGITPEILHNTQLSFEKAQLDVLRLINCEAVLCGHSLENDLNCLKVIHWRVADSSVLYPSQMYLKKNSLKKLASMYLKKNIQNVKFNQNAHDSVEDAITALQLIQLKIKRGLSFGVPPTIFREKNIFHSLSEKGIRTSLVNFEDLAVVNDVITGNVSVDIAGKIEKYLENSFELVITEWNNIKKIKPQEFDSKISENVKEIDERLKNLVKKASQDCLFIVVSGEGHVANEK